MTARGIQGSNGSSAHPALSRSARHAIATLHDLPPGARDLRELPVERYQRLRLAADILRRLFEGGAARVLTMPSDARDLGALLAGEPFELVTSVHGAPVDALVACDGLASVAPDKRERFVADAARMVRGALVVIGAFRRERAGLEALHGASASDAGPEQLELERAFAANGLEVATLAHGDPARALALACAAAQPGAASVQRDLNELLYRAGARAPFLRHAVIGWRTGLAASWLDELEPSFDERPAHEAFDVELAARLETLGLDPAREELERRATELEGLLERERVEAETAADLASAEFVTLRTELGELRTRAILEVAESRNALEAERDARHQCAERLATREALATAETARMRAEVETAHGETEVFDGLLRDARLENARLRGELQSRLANLRRALWPLPPRV